MPADPADLRRRMVDGVAADAIITANFADAMGRWRPALLEVPRHLFVPDTVWVDNPNGGTPKMAPLRRPEVDVDRWLDLVHQPTEAVITQVDDGQPEVPGDGGFSPTSSVSAPSVVTIMLCALDVAEGHRVLEIGTGSGYNAALLAHRLGAENVTSIEVDPGLAEGARRNLADTGYSGVRVVTGDGAAGYAPGARYDRVIATAACTQIPYQWVAQTRPGGRVLLPWSNNYFGGLVALTAADDGTAIGGVVAESSFMRLREQRYPRWCPPTDDSQPESTVTTVHPYRVGGDFDAGFAIGLRLPGCRWTYYPWDEHDPVGVLWLVDPRSGSSAKLTHSTPHPSDQGEYPLLQCGPRKLYDEAVAAYQWWVDAGRPAVDRWRFTVTPHEQWIDLVTDRQSEPPQRQDPAGTIGYDGVIRRAGEGPGR